MSGSFLIEKSDSIVTIKVAKVQNYTNRTGIIEGFQYRLSHICTNKTKKTPEHNYGVREFLETNYFLSAMAA